MADAAIALMLVFVGIAIAEALRGSPPAGPTGTVAPAPAVLPSFDRRIDEVVDRRALERVALAGELSTLAVLATVGLLGATLRELYRQKFDRMLDAATRCGLVAVAEARAVRLAANPRAVLHSIRVDAFGRLGLLGRLALALDG